jgi:hypothetical protein
MGSVEVALETKEGGGESVVALKRMLPNSVLDKRQTEMFLREAKLASLLVHPNIVHATSFGEISGELFLVMEYIEGEPLSRVLAAARERDRGLALPFVAHVLAEICEGLHAAHELKDAENRPLNVVHRDVSPHNVMVAYEGQIKLLDFGVAKIEAIGADGRTKTGEVKGKTAYMSPEQAMGDAIDRRSDLYSLGAVLFEAVAGRRMWGGGTDLEVLRRLALEEPPTLSEVVPGTPPLLSQLQKRLVERDPAKRPPTALEVARELRAFIGSTGARADARTVRAVMTDLFAPEVERRRVALHAAVEKVASGAIDELGEGFSSQVVHDVTPVPATRPAAPAIRHRWTPWLAVAAGIVIPAVVGGTLRWRGEATVVRAQLPTSMSEVRKPPELAAPIVPPSSASGAPNTEPPMSSTVSKKSNPAPPGPDSLVGRRPSGAGPRGGAEAKPLGAMPPETPGSRGGKPPPSTTKPTHPLDVDPTPF